VTFSSNPDARIDDVKSALSKGDVVTARQVEQCLRDVGFSHKNAKAFMANGFKALRDADNDKEILQAIKNSFSNIIPKR